MPFRSRLHSIVRPLIRNEGELSAYVLRLTVFCTLLALGFDVVNQLTFFVSWEASFRSWLITTLVASGITASVAVAIARAHLELYRAKLAVEVLSRTDPLTGLLNRRALLESIEEMQAGFMVLAIADIDRFKSVNDTHGHLVGDEVIKMVARALETELGRFGQIGRLGGEEFGFVATNAELDELLAKLWDFRDRVATTPTIVGSAGVWITISIGVATRKAGQSYTELFAEADRALYLAKASGRNRVVSADDLPVAEFAAAEEQLDAAESGRKFRSAG